MMVYGEVNLVLIFTRVARQYVLGAYGSDKLADMLRAELGPVGGDMVANLMIDYFAGLVTIGETVNGNTFTFINNYIGQIVDGLCNAMGNSDLGGISNMWALLRAEKTARALYLT